MWVDRQAVNIKNKSEYKKYRIAEIPAKEGKMNI